MLELARGLSHLMFQTRRNCDKLVKEFAKEVRNKQILEIGSGKQVSGKYPYSCKHFFDSSNSFIQSDINPSYGHPVVDVTRMNKRNQYDIIICLNVLEHVYYFQLAVTELHRSLKRKGTLLFFSPYIYPLHDVPSDYFRFSEFALRKMFSRFSRVEIKRFGLQRFPTGYYVEALK